MLKKILILLLLLTNLMAKSQLNNSWIDYSKTYYKFKVSENKLCRIYQSALQNIGLANYNAKDFQLWRNGQQVRLYTTTSNGTLDPSGYIEFFGQMNDGKPDKQLYRDPNFQIADQYSLETDTAAYFLTVNTASQNLRYLDTTIVIPSSPVFEPYCLKRTNFFYKDKINRGLYDDLYKEEIYSSCYDQSEGWTSNDIEGTSVLQYVFSGIHPYISSSPATFQLYVSLGGNTPNTTKSISVTITSNNISIGNNIALTAFATKKDFLFQNIPISLLQNSADLLVSLQNNTSNSIDRFVVAALGLKYPSLFDGNNATFFDFELPASIINTRYLSIQNFNNGTQPAILYDTTNGYRYVSQLNSTNQSLQFAITSNNLVSRYLLMSAQDINTITNFEQRNFVNFRQLAQQGNYLIITNPALNTTHAVDKYRDYRSSLSGGNYKAVNYYINELTDQFAFGIKNHPAAIRDFIRFAYDSFSVKPLYAFIIGRGINYIDYYSNQSNPIADQLNQVPTFGWPASDVLLAAKPGFTKPLITIGRLGAIYPTEVENYYHKMLQYESAQQNTSFGGNDNAWMKNIIHIIGGRSQSDYSQFNNYMNRYKAIVENISFGAHVETFTKTSNATVQQLGGTRVEQLIDSGVSFIGYFGHSSNSTLEFNLNDPNAYHNVGKYPFFQVSGCSAGNFFIFDPIRLNGPTTISEKYVLSDNRGSIGFLADTHFGIGNYLDDYNTPFYNAFCKNLYGDTLGKQLAYVYQVDNNTSNYYNRIHLEEILLHGDPALKINSFVKPDYIIDDKSVIISPSTITVKDSINLEVQMRNVGKAVGDSIHVSIKHRYPNGTDHKIVDTIIPSIKYLDIINRVIHINVSDAPKGLNKIIVDLDDTYRIDELNENNNSITKEFLIYEDELTPIWPQNFSIVNTPIRSFYASTSNPTCGPRNYILEVDTSELFNSNAPYKQRYSNSGLQQGGLIEFNNINMSLSDSSVYYWRVAIEPISGTDTLWNTSSFVYLPHDSSGYNQSHYYQFKKSSFSHISLDEDRKFRFMQQGHDFLFQTGLHPAHEYGDIQVIFDGQKIEFYGCHNNNLDDYTNLQFYVIDPITLKPWENYSDNSSSTSPGRFGSRHVCQGDGPGNRIFFEFNYALKSQRDSALAFLNAISAGMYIGLTNFSNYFDVVHPGDPFNTTFVDQWKSDRIANGVGNTLYDKLISIGFTQIDSFTKNLPFLFFYQKESTSFSPVQILGQDSTSYISQLFRLNSTFTNGQIISPLYGPAKKWEGLHWRGNTTDLNQQADKNFIQVFGRRFQNDSLTLLGYVNPALDTSLSFVDATTYPYLQLGFNSNDTVFYTPSQLRYLKVNADYVPEGAIAPSIFYLSKDTLSQGEPFSFSVAFKNVSNVDFDSLMKIKVVLFPENSNPDTIYLAKRKLLLAGDTLIASYMIDTRKYLGKVRMVMDINPDNDQREVTHFNNFLWKQFYVKEDKYSPLLDVTFDGVHILNGDYVSASPDIVIKLKDENKYIPITDTGSIKVKLIYGRDKSEHMYSVHDTSSFTFIPAGVGHGDNTATVEFHPKNLEDDDYELQVTGKDSMGNKAGLLAYSVFFKVYNKAAISNVFNYPNPFTTSTAFVFVLTGSEVPQNIRIQIMTISGKIVKEITKEELGPIHLGQNITDYKWDGTDMFGQPLGNGVYLYRVLTNLNGKRLDKFQGAQNDRYFSKGYGDTDKYFTSGYGKMYLMR